MAADIHELMHRDHRAWANEFNAWQDDVRVWQQEFAQAKSQFKELESAMAKHEEVLNHHASDMRLDEARSSSHEHALVEFEKGGAGEALPGMAKQHQLEDQEHVKRRQSHERLKRHRHELIARWRLLFRSLTDVSQK